MTDIARQRCFNHTDREAVAACPACHRPFCRECVTEHDDRVVCAACLRKLAPAGTRGRGARDTARLVVHGITSLILLWILFYALGHMLMALPTTFHEGALWRPQPVETP